MEKVNSIFKSILKSIRIFDTFHDREIKTRQNLPQTAKLSLQNPQIKALAADLTLQEFMIILNYRT